MAAREVKLGTMLSSLIERGGYSRNRQKILDAVGITPQALSQYTRNQTRPSFAKLVALADFFGVSLDYLVHGEPVSPPIDHGPLARYVEHALSEVQARASRHSDLMTRIGRVLADRVDGVARELADSSTAGREGLIQLDETLRTERYCLQADIVAMHLGFDVIQMEEGDGTTGGQFLQVVAANVVKGCRYRFLVPNASDGGGQAIEETVSSFRELLAELVGGDHLHDKCLFRRSAHPLISGVGLYHLDVAALGLEEPALFTQFAQYINADDRLGYLIRPNADSNADMLMNAEHLARACRAFDSLWSHGTPI